MVKWVLWAKSHKCSLKKYGALGLSCIFYFPLCRPWTIFLGIFIFVEAGRTFPHKYCRTKKEPDQGRQKCNYQIPNLPEQKKLEKKGEPRSFISCPVVPLVQSIAVEELNSKGLLPLMVWNHHPDVSAQTCAMCPACPGWGTGDRKPRWPHSSQINRAETDGWHKAKHPQYAPVPSPTWTLEKQLLQMVSVCGRQELGLSKTRNCMGLPVLCKCRDSPGSL